MEVTVSRETENVLAALEDFMFKEINSTIDAVGMGYKWLIGCRMRLGKGKSLNCGFNSITKY